MRNAKHKASGNATRAKIEALRSAMLAAVTVKAKAKLARQIRHQQRKLAVPIPHVLDTRVSDASSFARKRSKGKRYLYELVSIDKFVVTKSCEHTASKRELKAIRKAFANGAVFAFCGNCKGLIARV